MMTNEEMKRKVNNIILTDVRDVLLELIDRTAPREGAKVDYPTITLFCGIPVEEVIEVIEKYKTEMAQKPTTISADKVPVDWPVKVRDDDDEVWHNRYYFTCRRCFAPNTKLVSNGSATYWNSIKLAEPLTVDGVTYPEGCEVV